MSDQSEPGGAWIFVSHSNLDFAEVRQIRDWLERDGHKPLLFFLKCLKGDDARLPALIRDEIAARTWFILCESDNSKASAWVREEVAIVTASKPSETFVTVDLAKDLTVTQEGDIPPFVHKLRPLLKRATVFLSSSNRDAALVAQIRAALLEQDYKVVSDLAPGVVWEDGLKAALDDAAQNGFVLLLLSPDYLDSLWCAKEREWAFDALRSNRRSNLVPLVVADPVRVYANLPADLRMLQCLDMTKGPVVHNVMALLSDLKVRPMA